MKVLILLFLLTVPSFIRLVRPGYFSMQDDVQAFRLFEFDKCVKSLQIPCRWIPDGGAGYGYPLFNYYPPLPYALGEVFHLAGFGILDAVKILFILGFIGAAFSMYFLVSTIWGKTSGVLSAAFYLYAPYRAVNSYVRGDLSEFLALSIIPLLLLGIYLVVYRKKSAEIVFICSLTALVLTHLLTLLMLIPLGIAWTLYWISKSRRPSAFLDLVKCTFISLGIAAFSWLPALLERNLVTLNTITQGYFDYRGHFASLNQLFVSRFWGYGASLFQQSDMSLSIGHPQWLVPSVILSVVILAKKINSLRDKFFFIAVSLGFLYAFLAHNKSTPIWLSLPFLAYLQFPWRFVGLSVLAFSISIGAVKINSRILVGAIILMLIGLNIGFFKEDIWFQNLTDNQKLSESEVSKQNVSGLADYWPTSGENFPKNQAPLFPKFLSGGGTISSRIVGSDAATYTIFTREPSTVEFPIVYFPEWKAIDKLSKKEIPIKISPPLGLISLELPSGNIQVVLKLFNTRTRSLANIISLATLLLLMLSLAKFSTQKKHG